MMIHGGSLEVVCELVITTEDEYKLQLAKYNMARETHLSTAARAWVKDRITLLVADLDDSTHTKLSKLPLITESRVKVLLYATELDGHGLNCMNEAFWLEDRKLTRCLHPCRKLPRPARLGADQKEKA